MLGSVVLDVAIGMVFVYLLLSLIASAVLEIFAAVVQSRSANLQRGIRSLLSEDSIQSGITLAESIYKHGLTRGLYQDPHRDYGIATGIVDRMRLQLQKLANIAPPKEIAGISDPLLLPAYIPSRTFALALIDILVKTNDTWPQPMQRITGFLALHHTEFKDNKAVEALLALVENSDNDLVKFQANVENWYNDAMDRVSGWYKKYSQNVLLVIGLFLAVGVNVDTVQVARTLWLDRDARQEMVNAASSYLESHKEPTASAGLDAEMLRKNMTTSVHAFERVSTTELLPVGWNGSWTEIRRRQFSTWLVGLSTVGGWLMTAVALSLGAPFWFDTLNKFMIVRSTIKPREKSDADDSKD